MAGERISKAGATTGDDPENDGEGSDILPSNKQLTKTESTPCLTWTLRRATGEEATMLARKYMARDIARVQAE
jgi:hypothetical protein